MDLKLKDVTELLNVSETTIKRWISDGKIPYYRLNNQYRFSRSEIENWVLSCKQGGDLRSTAKSQDRIDPDYPRLAGQVAASIAAVRDALAAGAPLTPLDHPALQSVTRSMARVASPRAAPGARLKERVTAGNCP